jgi:hypothetical protein
MKEEGDGFDVAMLYPIQDITPKIPPTAISTESWSTIGLHSESINKYAYTKKPPMDKINIIIPTERRFAITLNTFAELFILI